MTTTMIFRDQSGQPYRLITEADGTEQVEYVTLDEYGDPIECIDDPDDCRGTVEYRAVPGGCAVPRCEGHFLARLDRWENSDLERYADSDVPPAWFDPTACGERWDDDY